MTEIIKDIFLWLIPTGGLGTVIVWIFNKKLRTLRTDKEVHDTYKEMYNDVKEELKDLRNENKILHKEFARMGAIVSTMETVISKAAACNYYAACPIRFELQQLQKHQRKTEIGQPGNKRKVRKTTHPDPGVEGESPDTDSEPSEPPTGSRLFGKTGTGEH